MRVATLVVSLTLSTSAAALAETQLEASLDACIESRFAVERAPSINESFKLSEACPFLSAALPTQAASMPLQEPIGPDTSLNQLMDLQALLRVSKAPAPTTSQFDFAGLKPLLARTLVTSPPPQVSAWQRFKDWLQAKFAKKEQTGDMDWLLRFLEKITPPKWLAELMLKGVIALILLLALVVIGNELRAGRPGLNWRRGVFRRPHVGSRALTPQSEAPSLVDIDKLSLQERPAALLKLVIFSLVNRDWLPNNPGLTNRELSAGFSKKYHDFGSQFERLIFAVEPFLYGGKKVEVSEMDALLAKGRDILHAR